MKGDQQPRHRWCDTAITYNMKEVAKVTSLLLDYAEPAAAIPALAHQNAHEPFIYHHAVTTIRGETLASALRALHSDFRKLIRRAGSRILSERR